MTDSLTDAVNYLTTKKFGPFTTSIVPTLGNMEFYKNSDLGKQALEIEEYKTMLRSMPPEKLLLLHQESLAIDFQTAKLNSINEEKSWCFNLKTADADFVHWAKAAHWTIDEAISLSFGKDPEIVTWKKIEPLIKKSEFAKVFAKRRDLALRATHWKKFGDTIPPLTFISWAKEINIELPSALIEEVTKICGSAINWHEQYQKLKADYDLLAAKSTNIQKPESTRKVENLLKALTAIAIREYGYFPEDEKSTAPQDISDALDERGVSTTAQTIRWWLKEGASLLPSKTSKL